MKIENEFVDYNTALALKKLGFDEPCLAYYENNDLTHGMLNDIGKRRYLQTPLYQQAFRWFRDKHDLPSEVRFVANLEVYDYRITKIGVGYTNSFYDGVRPTSAFKSYEEAELECLKQLIKIINENNYRKIN